MHNEQAIRGDSGQFGAIPCKAEALNEQQQGQFIPGDVEVLLPEDCTRGIWRREDGAKGLKPMKSNRTLYRASAPTHPYRCLPRVI